MIHRAFALLIVVFWMTMTALLLRHEFQPGDSALREVPVAHVVKLILTHGEESKLNIYSEKLRLGRLRVTPLVLRAENLREIRFDGDLQLLLPGVPRQRVAWSGEIEMEKTLAVRRVRFALKLHEPLEIRAEVTAFPMENRAHYELRSGSEVESHDFSLDEAGARALLESIGVDLALLNSVKGYPVGKPLLKATQSALQIHGEKIDTYLVTIEQSGQTLLEFHISQLGTILHARTLIGYTLAPDDVTP